MKTTEMRWGYCHYDCELDARVGVAVRILRHLKILMVGFA